MSQASAGIGDAFDASAVTGPPAGGDSRLADALTELDAAERRVAKAEATLAVVKASHKAALAAVNALQREGE